MNTKAFLLDHLGYTTPWGTYYDRPEFFCPQRYGHIRAWARTEDTAGCELHLQPGGLVPSHAEIIAWRISGAIGHKLYLWLMEPPKTICRPHGKKS